MQRRRGTGHPQLDAVTCSPGPAARTEIDEHDQALKQLLDQAAPRLVAERGIGYITAAQFYIAWSHPGRCHSEAAFARLGGT